MVSSINTLGQKRKYNQVFAPTDLAHKFSAKSDFLKYFKESCKF